MKTKTIAEHLKEYLEVPDRTISGPASSFKTNEFWAFNEILTGTGVDFMLFENGGRREFMVWMDSDTFKVAPFIQELHQSNRMNTVFMYQIGGLQTVLRELPKPFLTQIEKDVLFLKELLPTHYEVVPKKHPTRVSCKSKQGIPVEADFNRIFESMKFHFLERFMEVDHNVCTNHVDFNVYLRD